jgi:hypothetical protein
MPDNDVRDVEVGWYDRQHNQPSTSPEALFLRAA